LALSSLLWASYSYSEPYTYGATDTIRTNIWDMQDYLPDDPVVDINAVIYRYTTVKETEDDMLVHIQNKDTQGPGYIFRETDDWSGLPSATINKYVPVDNISASRFGEGSIEVEGKGQVTGQTISYSYRIDTAVTNVDPAFIPDIPEPPTPYNALEDDSISSSEAAVEDLEEEESDDTASDKDRKERALRASKKAVGIGATQAQLAMLSALTSVTFGQAYSIQIDGGTYVEDVSLTDAKLPENRQGLRNGLAQQILHTKMVDAQYGERP
jgi:hypothetical protein